MVFVKPMCFFVVPQVKGSLMILSRGVLVGGSRVGHGVWGLLLGGRGRGRGGKVPFFLLCFREGVVGRRGVCGRKGVARARVIISRCTPQTCIIFAPMRTGQMYSHEKPLQQVWICPRARSPI